MTDSPKLPGPRLHAELTELERMLDGIQARLDSVTALADRWAKIGAEHGPRVFTGNDHLLFANELRAALSRRPAMRQKQTSYSARHDETAEGAATTLGRFAGILDREFPGHDDWTIEAAAESLDAVITEAYRTWQCMIHAVQGEVEQWFDPQHSDLQPLVLEILAAAQLSSPSGPYGLFQGMRKIAIEKRLFETKAVPKPLAEIIAAHMLMADDNAIAQGTSRRTAIINEVDRWIALHGNAGKEMALYLHTGCPILAECIDIKA